jgi:uncharacterized membrane protein HdeD (DUF308 family)
MKMMQSDLRGVNVYILGLISLVLALFIPFSVLVLRLFNPLIAAMILSIGIPLIAMIIGVFGLIKSLKQQSQISKVGKILSIISIVIGIALVAFNLYIFIKSGGLSIM